MKPFYQDTHVTIYNCNALALPLADESVQCVVTSPPYYGLRKYAGEQELIWDNGHCEHEWGEKVKGGGYRSSDSHPGELQSMATCERAEMTRHFCNLCGCWRGAYGLEPTVAMYVQHTVEILAEIKRVLRKDGVCFWNVGDSYSGSGQGKGSDHGKAVFSDNDIEVPDWKSTGLKPKDLCLIPQRVAIAAQDAGWWVRSIIIWSKPNPMPESVTDRPTESHEYILMLTKSARYYWNQDAVLEPISDSTIGRGPVAFGGAKGREYNPDESDPNFRNGSEQWGRVYDYTKSSRKLANTNYGGDGSGLKGHSGNYGADGELLGNPLGRNIRTVWTFPTIPFSGAHFAVFPEELPKKCIMAATPPMCCAKCGAPYETIKERKPSNWQERKEHGATGGCAERGCNQQLGKGMTHDLDPVNATILGYEPSCSCNAGTSQSVVLDPFGGSGTTGKVAKELNRKAVLVDLSAEYCNLAVKRVSQVPIPMELNV